MISFYRLCPRIALGAILALLCSGLFVSPVLANAPVVASVKDYGAKGDGVTDDSSAFQSAINQLPPAGGIVFVPPGKYIIANQVNINRDNVSVQGVGNESKLSIKPGPYNTMFMVPSLDNNSKQVVKNISFSRLEFDGARVPSQWDTGPNFNKAFFGIWFGQAENVKLSELYMHDWVFEPFTFSNGNMSNRDVLVEKIAISGSARNGFHFGQGYNFLARLVHVSDVPSQQWGLAAGNALDLEVEGVHAIVDGAKISDSLFELDSNQTATGGVALQPAYGPLKNVTIERTLLRNFAGGVGVLGTRDNDVARLDTVVLQDNWIVDDNNNAYRNMFTVAKTDNVIAKNNVFNDYKYNAQPSVFIHDARNVTFENNRIYRPDCPFQVKFGSKQVTLKNNVYSENACAIDDDGANTGVVTSENTTVPDATVDRVAPTVSLGVTPNQVFTATAAISVSAQDVGVGVARIMYFIDSIPQGVIDASSGSFEFDPSRYQNGTHTVSARAWDKNGNIAPVKTVSVVVSGGATAPNPTPPVPIPPVPVPIPPPTGPAPAPTSGTNYVHNALVNDNGTIYLIMGTVKIPFTSMQVFNALGYQLKHVVKGSAAAYRLPYGGYLLNSPTMEHPWGAWVSIGKTVYVVHEQGLIPIATMEIFTRNGGSAERLVPANAADKTLLTKGNLTPLELVDPRVAGYWQ